jgi:hypothetical protein
MVSRGVGPTAAPDYAGPPSPSPAPTPVTWFRSPYGRKKQVGKRKKVASVMFTGAAATAMVGAAVQPAAAAPSDWTITPGGDITGHNDTPALLVVDGIFPVSLNCPVSTVDASGTLEETANGVNPQLGTITNATFGTAENPCSLFGLGVVATLDNPIGIHATGFPAGGVTPGKLGPNINATITGVDGFDCDMHVTGSSVPGEYDNAGVLRVNELVQRTLHIDHVDGCSIGGLPLFGVSDPAGFQADFTVDPVQTVTHES